MTSRHRKKFLGGVTPLARSPKEEEPGYGSGNDVVKPLTLSFDAAKTHDEDSYNTTFNKHVFNF